jgi:hypothetical protein
MLLPLLLDELVALLLSLLLTVLVWSVLVWVIVLELALPADMV